MEEKKRISIDATKAQHFFWKMSATKENISLKEYIIRCLPKVDLSDEKFEDNVKFILQEYGDVLESLSDK